MNRIVWALLALAAIAPASARGQEQEVQRAYDERRAQLQRETEETQRRLAELRSQRVQLQARLENAIAVDLQNRAQQLMMSGEQTALQGLDSILVASQDNLLSQRDRFRALGDAVRTRTGAQIVVLLRADSADAQAVALLTAAELEVNGARVAVRAYSSDAVRALQVGAVDQMYRADVLPARHTVRLSASVGTERLSQSVDVAAQGEMVTYVQFVVRSGQLVPTTWTSRGTTPF
jgi:hypothetical protein